MRFRAQMEKPCRVKAHHARRRILSRIFPVAYACGFYKIAPGTIRYCKIRLFAIPCGSPSSTSIPVLIAFIYSIIPLLLIPWYLSIMSGKTNKRHSMVEDVCVPKHLLATAKFDSPWEKVKWEKSLPENDRVQFQLPEAGSSKQQGGLSRSSSLSALRVTRPARSAAARPRSNPPALQCMSEMNPSLWFPSLPRHTLILIC